MNNALESRIPSLTEDAAERRRLLNILAQRRYSKVKLSADLKFKFADSLRETQAIKAPRTGSRIATSKAEVFTVWHPG